MVTYDQYETEISTLSIDTRTSNCLARMGYRYVRDLAGVSLETLLATRGLGVVSVRVLERALRQHGLTLPVAPIDAATPAPKTVVEPVQTGVTRIRGDFPGLKTFERIPARSEPTPTVGLREREVTPVPVTSVTKPGPVTYTVTTEGRVVTVRRPVAVGETVTLQGEPHTVATLLQFAEPTWEQHRRSPYVFAKTPDGWEWMLWSERAVKNYPWVEAVH